MAIDASQLTEYTWAQIKTAAKQAMINAAIGGSMLSINGRSIGRITPEQAIKLYETADKMEQIEGGGASGGNVLVQFGEAQ